MNASKHYTPKCVFITGATGDFGKAFAKRFDDLGCSLILHGRSQDKLDALLGLFKSPVHTVCFDITDKHAITDALQNLPSEFQNVDVLINNAGGALGLDPAQSANLDDWDMMIDTNAKSLARITRLTLPGMVERGYGHVINIGSMAGNYPYPGGNVYCAVKAFVKQFSLAIRADLHGTGVRVTNIEPGQVETQFSLTRFKGDAEKAAAVYAGTESLQAEDIAESVLWCATLPKHVNINRLEVMPTCQAFGPLVVDRKTG